MGLDSLLEKIHQKKAMISVIGLGRVGLPLASILANSNFKVLGIDVDSKRLSSIQNSVCPFFDPLLDEDNSYSWYPYFKRGVCRLFSTLYSYE
jgi:UDP-N-acetyl-D-mannosaminuronate dehydrogenase